MTTRGDEETTWLLREWENVLNDLERDVALTADRRRLGGEEVSPEPFQEEEKLAWSDPWLQAIDLEYHNIMPDQGLFLRTAPAGIDAQR